MFIHNFKVSFKVLSSKVIRWKTFHCVNIDDFWKELEMIIWKERMIIPNAPFSLWWIDNLLHRRDFSAIYSCMK